MQVRTLTQFAVPCADPADSLGRIVRVLEKAGARLTSLSAHGLAGLSCVRFLAEPPDNVVTALEAEGFQVYDSPSIAVELPPLPGQVARLCDQLGRAGVRVLSVSGDQPLGKGLRWLLAVDRPEAAVAALTEDQPSLEGAPNR